MEIVKTTIKIRRSEIYFFIEFSLPRKKKNKQLYYFNHNTTQNTILQFFCFGTTEFCARIVSHAVLQYGTKNDLRNGDRKKDGSAEVCAVYEDGFLESN